MRRRMSTAEAIVIALLVVGAVAATVWQERTWLGALISGCNAHPADCRPPVLDVSL